jgi:F420-non-reducing hydrogenase iron-sulfur subunit
MNDSAEPLIVGLFCTWCAYRAADLVGTTRRPYAANLRPIRVVCTGRVSPELILRTFKAGADGVLVVGCHAGECHRVDGNLKALRRLILLRRALAQVGVEQERVQLVLAAASEGAVLAEAADRMTAELRQLGPLARSSSGIGRAAGTARAR